MVYIVYGVAELILFIIVTRIVPDGDVSAEPFSLARTYAKALGDRRMIAIVAIVFGVGFSVFGTFSYSGHYVASLTGLPISLVGFVVTAFGVGTVASSRLLSRLQASLGPRLIPASGFAGMASLLLLSLPPLLGTLSLTMFILGYFGFGFAFVILQSTLVMTGQSFLPAMRGTAMSLVSFGMFVGGGIGTQVNGLFVSGGRMPLMYGVAALLVLGASLSLSMIRRRAAAVTVMAPSS